MDRIVKRTHTHNQTQKMPYASVFRSSECQNRWREHMRLNYFYNHGISPSVLQVPESLRETKPEAYAPQIVGLGPYHHFRPEVQQMERKKRAAVISYLNGKTISDLFKICPKRFEPSIRSCYDGYLDLDMETLAWVVIVDGLFLLHFMSTYLGECEEEKQKIYSDIEALIPDVMMLENQIPFILMEDMRTILDQPCDDASEIVMKENIRMMKENIHKFCVKQSPLQFTTDEGIMEGAFNQNNHMLHYMYELIVQNQSQTDGKDSQGRKNGGSSQGQTDSTGRAGDLAKEIGVQAGGSSQGQTDSTGRLGELAKEIGVQAGEILQQGIEEYYTALAYANSAGLKVPGNVEKVSNILRNLQKTLHLDHMNGSFGDQIDIPSASRLKAILKLKFKPLPDNCGIGNIKLENKILHLPVITLNSNSEVILRNLLAYESTSKLRSTKLREYMDLICGIIKSEKDVALLRGGKIIEGQLPDAEIVRMCNGIKKSDEKLDENSNVHKTLKVVKDNFNNNGVVKACRSTMKGFAALVKSVNQLFPILVLLFLALQSFCEIYDCRRSSHGGAALWNSYLGELELDPKSKLMLPRKVYRY